MINFINLVKPYVSEVSCMKYEINLKERFEEKRAALKKLGWCNINYWEEKVTNNSYSKGKWYF